MDKSQKNLDKSGYKIFSALIDFDMFYAVKSSKDKA